MGCGCKKKSTVNNLNSGDHVGLAKQVWADIISKKSVEELTDFDKMEVYGAFAALYPNAKINPPIENAIAEIEKGIAYFDIKLENKRSNKRR